MGTKKINEALGIGNVEDFLSDLNIDDDVKQLNNIDEQVKHNVDKIDQQIANYKDGGI